MSKEFWPKGPGFLRKNKKKIITVGNPVQPKPQQASDPNPSNKRSIKSKGNVPNYK